MDTIRRQIIALLRDDEMTAQEISQAVKIREREVCDHLPHIAKTVSGGAEKLVMAPPECLACGYTFSGRSRFTKPGRCPRCRATRVSPPAYRITCTPKK